MFERFTNRARHVVVLAQEEARRLDHNYIGTEHLLLGLLGEPESIGGRVLTGIGMSLDGARAEVAAITGKGKRTPSGHIPFTPRAKKILELALREALQLNHNYIGTEHILLGIVREGEGAPGKTSVKESKTGVAARVLRQHADLVAIRAAVLDLVPAYSGDMARIAHRWLRRRPAAGPGETEPQAESTELTATPAVDLTLSEAARLAGAQPVGSHHLLLAALADPDSAAARALATLGIDLDHARDALSRADVTGTSDEPLPEAGRRQMTIRVADDRLVLEAGDRHIVAAGKAAVSSLGDRAGNTGTITGDLPAAASLADVWQALHNSLNAIAQRAAAASPPDTPPGEDPEAA